MAINSISVEQFAAFLDGNLPESEMNQIKTLAEKDSMLHELIEASSIIDSELSDCSIENIECPFDIDSLAFELPTINLEHFSYESELDNNLVFHDICFSDELLTSIESNSLSDTDTTHTTFDDSNIINLRPEDENIFGNEDSSNFEDL